ncbi:gyrA [Symbiodinium natans]|uniref:GyrA protein n=1 Tax=Symbiodinium natans TaxID=878477 RepID=A0A812NDW7_9DINO|nr:gyrA [Symbiodinium natans]
MSEESFLVNKQCVLVLSRNFTAKRVRTSEWKARRRGGGFGRSKRLVGKAKKGQKEEEGEEDAEEHEEEEQTEGALSTVFCCHDFDALLVFSEHGFVYMLQALDVPLVKKSNMEGAQLKDFLPELEDHRITALVTVSHRSLREQTDDFVVLLSEKGFAKKVSVDRFRGLRPGKGLQAMKLVADDKLQWAHKASANSALVVVTAEGCVLRVSLGQDWSLSTAKGPGRLVIKMAKKFQDDYIAASSISELTAAELANIRAKAAAKASAAAAVRAKTEDPAKAENDESDKDEPAEREEAAGDDSDEDEKDGDEDAGNDRAVDGVQDEVMDAGQEVAVDDSANSANSDLGPCVLLVTKCGLGARVPLSWKRIGLGRRGGVPKRVLRVADNDSVVAACVVSGRDIKEPAKPLEALQLYLKEHADAAEAGVNSLPEEDLMPYRQQEQEAKRKYAEDLESFRRQDCEEVLLGSTGGAVTRIKVSTVPVHARERRGRVLAKTKGSDRICLASLLSSIEDDGDETGKEATKLTPSNSAASRRRRAADPGPDSAGSGSTLRGSEAHEVLEPKATEAAVPLPVERTPRSKLTQSLAKRRRSSNMSSPRQRSPRSPIQSSIRLLKPKLRVLKSPFFAKSMIPKVSTFDITLGRFVS